MRFLEVSDTLNEFANRFFQFSTYNKNSTRPEATASTRKQFTWKP
jgi:hypothetical protein